MYPAIFSRTYPQRQIGKVLQAIRDDGFAGAQMNLSSFGMDSLPDDLDAAALDQGRQCAGDLGITMAALSGTYNMAHPDADARRAKRRGFAHVLRAAAQLGTPIVTLCTGSRNAADMWAEHPLNETPEAWADMRAEIDWALDLADQHGLILAIEPEPANIIRDAAAARHLLDQTGAPHLKIILDAANLIGPEGLNRQGDIMARAIDLLGADIVLAHAKDIDAAGLVVPPGQGAIDLPLFTAALRGAGFDGALIGHGFAASDTAAAARSLTDLCRAPA